MADEENDSGNARSNRNIAEAGANPENGSPLGAGRAIGLLQETPGKALEGHFMEVARCILVNFGEEHLLETKLLSDLATKAKTADVEPEEYQSLAEVLWAAYRGQDGGESSGVTGLPGA